MDAWSAEQLQRMQLGGNDALNVFLKNYGVDKYTDIRDKYNSQAAEVRLLYCWQISCTSVLLVNISLTESTSTPECTQRHQLDIHCIAVLPRQNQG